MWAVLGLARHEIGLTGLKQVWHVLGMKEARHTAKHGGTRQGTPLRQCGMLCLALWPVQSLAWSSPRMELHVAVERAACAGPCHSARAAPRPCSPPHAMVGHRPTPDVLSTLCAPVLTTTRIPLCRSSPAQPPRARLAVPLTAHSTVAPRGVPRHCTVSCASILPTACVLPRHHARHPMLQPGHRPMPRRRVRPTMPPAARQTSSSTSRHAACCPPDRCPTWSSTFCTEHACPCHHACRPMLCLGHRPTSDPSWKGAEVAGETEP